VTDSGTSSDQYSYQLAITGTYSNGVFTITSESYNETGSYNFSWKATWNSSSLDGSSTSNQDMSSSGNYMLSWDAAPDDNGQLVFTAYSYSATAKSTWDINSSGSDGSYVEDDFGTSGSIDMTGSGTTASSTGTITTDTYLHSYTPLPDGSSIDTTYEDEETNPVSGTADLSSLLVQSTSGWQWEAGASNAVNYNFHGVSSETANLTETSTYQVTNSGTTFVVNAFNSSSQTADSSHVVDDEPETPASSGGSDSFHRDEAYSNSDNVTGSGSYGGGQTNATFQGVQVATYNVADSLTDNNETVTGTDANGNTYTTNYNYGGQVNGSGTFTTTDNYQDVSNGLALSSETLQSSGTGQNSYQYSGTTNGQAFDDCGSTPESFNDPAETFQGSPAPVTNPDGLENAFPFQDTVSPNGAVFGVPNGGGGVGGTGGGGGVFLQVNPSKTVKTGLQAWYNHKIEQIGEQAKKKVADQATHKAVMDHIRETNMAWDTFTFFSTNLDAQGQPVNGPRGATFAAAMGEADKLAKWQQQSLKPSTAKKAFIPT
jgi:hypothetical protein